jgi:glycosyltransferase 2 family protein
MGSVDARVLGGRDMPWPDRSAEPAGRVERLGMGRPKLIAGTLAFLALTVGVFWYQVARIQAGDAAPTWHRLRWAYLGLIVLCLPLETLASGLRMWVVSRTLQPEVRLWTCLKAEWVNVAMNLLTPAHSGGGPGQIYMLSREGVRPGTALTISLLGFLGTMVGLFGMGLYSVLVSDLGHVGSLFTTSVLALGGLAAAMGLAAGRPALLRGMLGPLSRGVARVAGPRVILRDWWPPAAEPSAAPVDRLDPLTGRLVTLIYDYHDDVRRFLRVGKARLVWVCLLSLVFLFSRAYLAYLCVRFLGLDGSTFRHVMEIQMALIFLVFFAPTPGGAGIAEAASLSLMAGIVPVGFAPYYNLLWRFATAYLPSIAGLVCLGNAVIEDARTLARSRAERDHADGA